jgi:Mg2+-importing ATPase
MIPFTPIGSALGMVPLPGLYFTWLAVILVGYCTFTQVIKSWFVARYGYN